MAVWLEEREGEVQSGTVFAQSNHHIFYSFIDYAVAGIWNKYGVQSTNFTKLVIGLFGSSSLINGWDMGAWSLLLNMYCHNPVNLTHSGYTNNHDLYKITRHDRCSTAFYSILEMLF